MHKGLKDLPYARTQQSPQDVATYTRDSANQSAGAILGAFLRSSGLRVSEGQYPTQWVLSEDLPLMRKFTHAYDAEGYPV